MTLEAEKPEIPSVENSVAEMIGKAYSVTSSPTAGVGEIEPLHEYAKFQFAEDFQTKIMTLCLRDLGFMSKVGHLIRPEYFDNAGEAALVDIAVNYYDQFKTVPGYKSAVELMKSAKVVKKITAATEPAAIAAFRAAYGSAADLTDSEYTATTVATFARHQEMTRAIFDSVSLLDSHKFDKIESKIKAANAVGINDEPEEYDFYAKIEERTEQRRERAAGMAPITGVTTGLKQMDEKLYHQGWGRKELSVLMGGAKSGKTTAMINFAKAASLAGKNVLYVTLEVSADIIGMRMDASMSSTFIKELVTSLNTVKAKITEAAATAGALRIAEYPPNSFTPNDLQRLIDSYKSPKIDKHGRVREPIKLDLVVVDYADIMAPNNRNQDTIENSKNIWLDLRAIAVREDLAMLSATQTNREGFKSSVAKAEHVADDFNKVRTVDLMISINVTDEERAEGVCRLYFAASRNQEGGFTIHVKQDLAKMIFASHVIKIE